MKMGIHKTIQLKSLKLVYPFTLRVTGKIQKMVFPIVYMSENTEAIIYFILFFQQLSDRSYGSFPTNFPIVHMAAI